MEEIDEARRLALSLAVRQSQFHQYHSQYLEALSEIVSGSERERERVSESESAWARDNNKRLEVEEIDEARRLALLLTVRQNQFHQYYTWRRA